MNLNTIIVGLALSVSLFPATSSALQLEGEREEFQFGSIFSEWQSSGCKTIDAPSLGEIEDYIRSQEAKTVQKAFQSLKAPKAEGCTTVLCAVEKTWGEDLGLKILYTKLRFGFNVSEFASISSDRLSSEHIDQIIITLSDLPKNLQTMGEGKKIVLSSSQRKGAAADANGSRIRLYQFWRDVTGGVVADYNRQYALYHEIGHVRGFRGGLFGEHSSGAWKALHASGCFVSKYSRTNNKEDFAETFATYRYNAGLLQRKCPEKYAFMRDRVFGGIEYTDSMACLREPEEVKRGPRKSIFDGIFRRSARIPQR